MTTNDLTHLIGDDYETMDGRPARVVAIRKGDNRCQVLALIDHGDRESLHHLYPDLSEFASAPTPVIRRKPKRETRQCWLHMFEDPDFVIAKRTSEPMITPKPIACVRVEVSFCHGEGL